jgi:hypothetical protein
MPIVDKPPSIKYFRSNPAIGAPKKVDKEKRIINGYAVITRGEALGHGFWVDSKMLEQVAEFGNEKENGLKTRFTHPGLCSDGLGKYLGRAKNFEVDGDIVRADLHLARSASKTPSGDLAGYVLDLALEDPESFGTSIVFSHDSDAEFQFMDSNTDEEGDFITPDELNVKNLPHTRLKALKASDVVDEPAANPGGFFSDKDEILSRAEEGLSYIFGLSEAKPDALSLGIDADRAKQFVERFCKRHGLSIQQLPEVVDMTPDEFAKANPAAVQAWRDEGSNQAEALFQERVKSFQSAFTGRESFALSKLAEGRELIEARAEFSDVLLSELAEAKAAPVIQHQVIRQTGIQFNAGERELITEHVQDFSHLAPKERAVEEWKAKPEIRAEFDNPESYAAWMKFAPRINGGE